MVTASQSRQSQSRKRRYMGRTALVTLLLLGLVETAASSTRAQPMQEGQPSKQYRFTYDYFTSNIPPVWREVLAPYQRRPNVHYLEVGVFEGGSAIWMLENVLTHPSSTLTGIDTFPGDLMNRYLANLQISGYANKATTIKGRSQIELRRLQPDSYNIIYIDGNHSADMVLADAVLSWDLLKTGGVLIFDDYRWPLWRPKYPDELKPAVAIDAFITAYRNYLDVLHHSYQVILRKKQGPPLVGPSTVLGEYAYAWDSGELRRRSDDRQVELSDAEGHALETLVLSRPFGEAAFIVGPLRALDPNLWALRERLGIEFEVRVLDMEAFSWLAGLLVGVGVTLVAVRPRRGVATK